MDITVTIPDKHLVKVAEAYQPWGYVPLAEGTAAEKKAHLGEWFAARWASEVRQTVTDKARQDAVRVVTETMNAEDPLAP